MAKRKKKVMYKSKYAKLREQGELGIIDKAFDLTKLTEMGDLLKKLKEVIVILNISVKY